MVKHLDSHWNGLTPRSEAVSGFGTFNLGLSRRRAVSVVKCLVDHGFDKARLTSQGFGETRQLQTNDTDEGRQNNRRVEFHILEDGDKKVDRASSTTISKPSKASNE